MSKNPPPGATGSRFKVFKISYVVATAAEIVGMPEAFSMFSMAGSDGICTQAEATIASIPVTSNFLQSSAGALGS